MDMKVYPWVVHGAKPILDVGVLIIHLIYEFVLIHF